MTRRPLTGCVWKEHFTYIVMNHYENVSLRAGAQCSISMHSLLTTWKGLGAPWPAGESARELFQTWDRLQSQILLVQVLDSHFLAVTLDESLHLSVPQFLHL